MTLPEVPNGLGSGGGGEGRKEGRQKRGRQTLLWLSLPPNSPFSQRKAACALLQITQHKPSLRDDLAVGMTAKPFARPEPPPLAAATLRFEGYSRHPVEAGKRGGEVGSGLARAVTGAPHFPPPAPNSFSWHPSSKLLPQRGGKNEQ